MIVVVVHVAAVEALMKKKERRGQNRMKETQFATKKWCIFWVWPRPLPPLKVNVLVLQVLFLSLTRFSTKLRVLVPCFLTLRKTLLCQKLFKLDSPRHHNSIPFAQTKIHNWELHMTLKSSTKTQIYILPQLFSPNPSKNIYVYVCLNSEVGLLFGKVLVWGFLIGNFKVLYLISHQNALHCTFMDVKMTIFKNCDKCCNNTLWEIQQMDLCKWKLNC